MGGGGGKGIQRAKINNSTAIDLMDEACAKLKNELTSKPLVLDEIDRRVIQLEVSVSGGV